MSSRRVSSAYGRRQFGPVPLGIHGEQIVNHVFSPDEIRSNLTETKKNKKAVAIDSRRHL